jgi:hypothetical protein
MGKSLGEYFDDMQGLPDAPVRNRRRTCAALMWARSVEVTYDPDDLTAPMQVWRDGMVIATYPIPSGVRPGDTLGLMVPDAGWFPAQPRKAEHGTDGIVQLSDDDHREVSRVREVGHCTGSGSA